MVFGVPVRVPDSGLPVWQEALLAVLGCALAFAILYGLYQLTLVPQARRMRKRVVAVEAAAGEGSIFGAAAVRAAAASLFREMQGAWDAADRRRLARISASGLMAGWTTRLDGNETAGVRYRVAVVKGPEIDYVGVMDCPDDSADHVCVRVRAKLRCFLELPDKSRRPVPEANGSQRMSIEEYWTLSRRDGEWIIYSIRPASYGKEILAEEIVGPAA
jgi:predicted lipid-binding transport protein (Tim44 family)